MTGLPEELPAPVAIRLNVNGQSVAGHAEPRQHLADFLRQGLGLKGTRIGCEQGHCGACTVEVEGEAVRACLTLAVQVEGKQVRTIEGMSDDPLGKTLQDSFIKHHAMQCGYCTAGMIISAKELLTVNPQPSREQVRHHLSGNYCRCTGYEAIVNAVMAVAGLLAQGGGSDV